VPRCLHPEDTFDIALDSDLRLPEDERPVFTFRPLSIRQWRVCISAIERVQGLDDSHPENVGPAIDAICDVLRTGLVGWRNMLDHNVADGAEPLWIPYDPAKLDELLDMNEATELMQKMMSANELTVEDKKKSASPPSSARASSARTARTGGVSTNPRR